MHKLLLSGLVSTLMVINGSAQDKKPEEVVKQAIDAHGGAEVLDRYLAGEFKMKGQMTLFGLDLDFVSTMTYQVPVKYRLAIDTEVMGQALNILQIVNGDKMKNSVNGMTQPASEKEQAELRQAAFQQEIAQLTPLLKPKYTLKSLGKSEVDGTPVNTVLVTAKGLKETKLFFDSKSGYLLKTERQGLAPSMGDPKEVIETTVYSDFRKVDGMVVPHKIVVSHDGMKFMAVTVTDAKIMEKADDTLFTIDD